jgi:hypothetical protein
LEIARGSDGEVGLLAFGEEEMRKWLNSERPKGAPAVEEIVTAQSFAESLEASFRKLVEDEGGQKAGQS